MSSRKSRVWLFLLRAWHKMNEMWNKTVTLPRFQRMRRRSVLSGWVGKRYSTKQHFWKELFHCLPSPWPLPKTILHPQALRTAAVFTPPASWARTACLRGGYLVLDTQETYPWSSNQTCVVLVKWLIWSSLFFPLTFDLRNPGMLPGGDRKGSW